MFERFFESFIAGGFLRDELKSIVLDAVKAAWWDGFYRGAVLGIIVVVLAWLATGRKS